MLATQHEDSNTNTRAYIKKPQLVVYACNPTAGGSWGHSSEGEKGGSLGLTGQPPSLISELRPVHVIPSSCAQSQWPKLPVLMGDDSQEGCVERGMVIHRSRRSSVGSRPARSA